MPYADPEASRIYHREYKRANRWRYRRTQKIYDATKHANERSAEAGCEGVLTVEEVEAILSSGSCHYCHRPADLMELTLDHVVPTVDGGLNRPENIVAACGSCNHSKRRADRPHRWSQGWEACVECGRTDSAYYAHGVCNRCALRRRPRRGRSAA